MEIALFLIVAFVSIMYFSAERRASPLHRTFGMILIVTMVHLILDGATVYTVNRLEFVPEIVNDLLHRFFLGTLVLIVFLFYLYISLLIQEEVGNGRRFDLLAGGILAVTELGMAFLPVHYAITPEGNYADGIQAITCYVCVAFYLLLCAYLLICHWKRLHPKKKLAIGTALAVEGCISVAQFFHPTWLISGMGITLITLSFYLTLENPDILRSELTEQKMSMLYLKSQIDPHFLYNTLDTIRIQAELNGDKAVAGLLMRLVDFFRLSVKMDRQMVTLDEELEQLEAYLELMCCRYPELSVSYRIDPELGEVLVPNFILQPIVENSLLHGLKNKGYRGSVTISASRADAAGKIELLVTDSGSGFAPGIREKVNQMLLYYDRQPAKLEGSSIGLLNVQKRIKLLCGRDCGLSFTDNPEGGVTAHLLLRITEEKSL